MSTGRWRYLQGWHPVDAFSGRPRWRAPARQVLPGAVLCLLVGCGDCLAENAEGASPETAFEACVPEASPRIEVEGPDDDGVYREVAGKRFHPVELHWPGADWTGRAGSADAPKGFEAVPLGPEDRWGRVPSWIVRLEGGKTRLLQAVLLEEGLAVYAPEYASGDCAELLREAEQAARFGRRGVWKNRDVRQVFSTAAPDRLAPMTGNYVIARGRVVSLGKSGSTRYLNFGKYWKTDFTATLKTSDEERFDEALRRTGWRIGDLAGKQVELRGVLQEWDGPHILLRHPEQLNVLEPSVPR